MNVPKLKITLNSGRIVEGEITKEQKRPPVLLIEGKPFSGLKAVNEGISIDRIDDPIFDEWLCTI